MRHTNLEDSEIFNIFAKIATEQGLLEKKAELLYPDYDIGAKNYELNMGLTSVAAKDGAEALIGEAHKGGGTTTQLDMKPKDNFGKVETIVEQHKIIEEIARRNPSIRMAKLVEKLVILAGKYEDAGLVALADQIDIELNKVARETDFIFPAEEAQQAAFEKSQMPEGEQLTAPYNFTEKDADRLNRNDPNLSTDYIVENNKQIQSMVNTIRAQNGQAPIATSGRMDGAFQSALQELGIQPGSYNSWPQLRQMVQDAGRHGFSSQQSNYTDAPSGQVAHRPGNVGAPANLPAGAMSLPVPPSFK